MSRLTADVVFRTRLARNARCSTTSHLTAQGSSTKVDWPGLSDTANPRTNIMDFRGYDSSIILIVRGGIPRPTGSLR